MKHIKESTLVNVVDSEEYEAKGSSQKPFITTAKHHATPDNLSQKLRLDKKTSLADYFRHKGIIFKTMSVTRLQFSQLSPENHEFKYCFHRSFTLNSFRFIQILRRLIMSVAMFAMSISKTRCLSARTVLIMICVVLA